MGKAGARGRLLKARNCRYLYGDHRERLWALPGRSAYNAAEPPDATIPTVDATVAKSLFGVIHDAGSSALVFHRGGAIYEGSLANSGTFAEVFSIAQMGADSVPGAVPAPFYSPKDSLYYPCGGNGWSSQRHFLVRAASGWRLGGHRKPTGSFGALPTGVGSFGSTKTIRYTYRIYSTVTDTESQHGPVVDVGAFEGFASVRLTWPAGVTTNGELGTHVRIYRTIPSEDAGIFYRVDGSNQGIALASFVPGFTYDDNLDGATSIVNGAVRADGEEGTIGWAEHGGAPPRATGGVFFQEHLLLYGIFGRPSEIIASAKGYPESFPVDFDGEYAYTQTFQTDKADEVRRVVLAGGVAVALCANSVWRINSIPTLNDPGFGAAVVQEQIQDEHGVVGAKAAASFAVGKQNTPSQACFYVSREVGFAITDGVTCVPVVKEFDFISLVEPSRLSEIEVRNNVARRELWVFYTPVGGTQNTQAVIVNYDSTERIGLRITWPADVTEAVSAFAYGTDNVGRQYVGDARGIVYLQDSGTTDAQKNTNAAGDVVIEVQPGRQVFGQASEVQARRGFLYGVSGTQRTVTVVSSALQGEESVSVQESVRVGDGETSDSFMIDLSGIGFDLAFSFQGPSGSTYDEAASTCCLGFGSVEIEVEHAGEKTAARA